MSARGFRFGWHLDGNAIDMAELTRRHTRSVLRGRERPPRAKPWLSRASSGRPEHEEPDLQQAYYWWRLERDFFGLTLARHVLTRSSR